MSEDSTFFSKPKVRFSQTTNIKESSEDLSKKKTVVKKNLPKIKNIVSLKTPVKILSFPKQLDNAINTNILAIDDEAKKEAEILYEDTQSLSEKKDDSTLQHQIMSKAVDKESSKTTLYGMENLNGNNIKQISRVSNKSSCKDISDITSSSTFPVTTSNKNLCKALKPTNTIATNIPKRSTKTKLDEGKENKNSSMKRAPYLITDKKVVKPLCLKTTHIKKKANVNEISANKSNLKKRDVKNQSCTLNIDKETKKTVGTYGKPPWKNSNKHFSGTNVMPCHKYKKVTLKNKSSLVKKSVVHDIIVPNAKAYVESGIPKKLIDVDANQISKDIKSKIKSSDKLSHPEINSIVCISTKLNEVKNGKIVTDAEHLPITYRNLLNGKISSALDFPLNEIIYKNLVDLSINDKQFPSKITRSRDPQPRERDLVPKLSDFFIPESTEEYYTSMSVRPRNSEITESWDAFRISDKVCKWKDTMDS